MTNMEPTSVGMLTGAEVVCVGPEATMQEAAETMSESGIGALVVGSTSEVQGVLSERDVIRAVAERRDLTTLSAGEVASTKLVWADAAAPVDEVAMEMVERWVRHVLVEENGDLVGIVSARDLLGIYAAEADTGD